MHLLAWIINFIHFINLIFYIYYVFLYILYLHLTLNSQFCPLFVFHTKKFPAVLLNARDQYIQQTLYTVTVLSDDGPVRPEICRSWCLTILL